MRCGFSSARFIFGSTPYSAKPGVSGRGCDLPSFSVSYKKGPRPKLRRGRSSSKKSLQLYPLRKRDSFLYPSLKGKSVSSFFFLLTKEVVCHTPRFVQRNVITLDTQRLHGGSKHPLGDPSRTLVPCPSRGAFASAEFASLNHHDDSSLLEVLSVLSIAAGKGSLSSSHTPDAAYSARLALLHKAPVLEPMHLPQSGERHQQLLDLVFPRALERACDVAATQRRLGPQH